MTGFNVFSPIGFDSFGLPAENYAIKHGVPPAVSISQNINTMIEQLKCIGCMYDWEHSVTTSSPQYYKWTQWLFALMYKAGLAYKKEASVPYCESCKTVLAREQVKEYRCDRCSSAVSQRLMKQWYWRITAYADQLLEGLKDLNWPDRTKIMQENWIGKSQGITFTFKVRELPLAIDVYDSIPQTYIAQTFVVVAPDHPIALKLIEGTEYEELGRRFISAVAERKQLDPHSDYIDGCFTGRYVENPFGTGDLPIWLASYALADYGAGAISCSAHDERDFRFAKKYGIPLRVAMLPTDPVKAELVKSFKISCNGHDPGILISPPELAGLGWEEAREPAIHHILSRSIGKRDTHYRLRDWTISRQRYWGAPIPVVYDPQGEPHLIPEEYLPWELPTDVDFNPTGVSPLAESHELRARTERIFGEGWTPEVDTMDTFVCSSFYSLRFLDPCNSQALASPEKLREWLPVDMYIGGAEHACMHLLYARFVTRVLFDAGYCPVQEPYKRLFHQGTILKDGFKMSKSRGNVVSPDDYVRAYGSDAFRLFLLEMGPYASNANWNDQAINGAVRFIQRVYSATLKAVHQPGDLTEAVRNALAKTICSVTGDVEKLCFNTAISSLKKLLNAIEKDASYNAHSMGPFIKMLAPFAPHLAGKLFSNRIARCLRSSGRSTISTLSTRYRWKLP
jgi:leucyl-tRNA synthetase